MSTKPTRKNIYITVNTDASFKNGASGGAYWIVYNQPGVDKPFRIFNSWGFGASNSLEAEMQTILAALERVASRDLPGDIIRVNTDCVAAINWFSGNGPESPVYNAFRRLCATKLLNRKIEFRHVRAHSTERNPKARTWVNNWCDTQAKLARVTYEERRAARRQSAGAA